MTQSRGKFITIEGQDGAGKSTNVAVIQAYLESNNIDYVHTREPGGTPFGEKLRNLILDSEKDFFGDKAELLLMFSARAQHLEAVIEPALAEGKWVLCDRFTDATYAYQGGGRKMPVSDIQTLEMLVQGQLRPDLTILLDVPVEVGLQRAQSRGEADRFEKEKIKFKQRVRDTYLLIAQSHPKRVRLVDASQDIDAVKQQIVTVMQDFCA